MTFLRQPCPQRSDIQRDVVDFHADLSPDGAQFSNSSSSARQQNEISERQMPMNRAMRMGKRTAETRSNS